MRGLIGLHVFVSCLLNLGVLCHCNAPNGFGYLYMESRLCTDAVTSYAGTPMQSLESLHHMNGLLLHNVSLRYFPPVIAIVPSFT